MRSRRVRHDWACTHTCMTGHLSTESVLTVSLPISLRDSVMETITQSYPYWSLRSLLRCHSRLHRILNSALPHGLMCVCVCVGTCMPLIISLSSTEFLRENIVERHLHSKNFPMCWECNGKQTRKKPCPHSAYILVGRLGIRVHSTHSFSAILYPCCSGTAFQFPDQLSFCIHRLY